MARRRCEIDMFVKKLDMELDKAGQNMWRSPVFKNCMEPNPNYRIRRVPDTTNDRRELFNVITGAFLTIHRDLCGYEYVHGYRDGKKSQYLLHRLRWLTFVGNIAEDKTIDHIDRDKSNNDLSNLRLASRQEQALNKGAIANIAAKIAIRDQNGVQYPSLLDASRSLGLSVGWVARSIKEGKPAKDYHFDYVRSREPEDSWLPLLHGTKYHFSTKTGKLSRLMESVNGMCRVDVSMTPSPKGFISVWCQDRHLLLHRLIWSRTHGDAEIPANYQVDHINGDRLDNRPENLQCLSTREHGIKTHGRKLLVNGNAYDTIKAAVVAEQLSPFQLKRMIDEADHRVQMITPPRSPRRKRLKLSSIASSVSEMDISVERIVDTTS